METQPAPFCALVPPPPDLTALHDPHPVLQPCVLLAGASCLRAFALPCLCRRPLPRVPSQCSLPCLVSP